MDTERSFAAPVHHDDAWIEHWAGVYLDVHRHRILRSLGVGFETFLRAPVEIMVLIENPPACVLLPGLLPAQRRVQERLDAADALVDRAERQLERDGARYAGCGWMVKLKHRTWPRHQVKRDVVEA